MDFRDLSYFQTIAETGHLGRAAEALRRTKPALSKCVRRLEGEIGAQLFHREGRRIVLTAVGDVLLRKARQMRISMEEMIAEVSGFVDGSIGHVRIGTGPTVAEYILPDIFARIMHDYPGLTTEISVGLGNELRTALVDNRLDMIISTILPTDDDRFSVHHFATDEVVVVASPRHPLCRKKFRMADLLDYKWMLPDRTVASRQWIDGAFSLKGLRAPEVLIESSSLQLLPLIMERTDVLGFTPRNNLKEGRVAASLAELPFEATTMRRRIGVLYRKVPGLSPALAQLLRIVQPIMQNYNTDHTFSRRN